MPPSVAPYLRRLLDDSPSSPSGAPAADPGPAAVPLLRRVSREFPEEALDPEAVRVIRKLTGAGHQAYLVGGCVRDLLFGVRPKDFDVVTSAHPPDIKRLFRNCRVIGRRFRLAHVYFKDKTIEVATFRAHVPQAPGDEADELLIRDDNAFGTADQDAIRRDFTINALFYDVDEQRILDYVGGVDDAERRVVRSIGDPQIRLREDPIRILRAIRLASRLGSTIDPATWRAIEQHRGCVLDAAAPRIGEDMLRMFRGGAIAPAFDLMLASGVLEVVLPELFAHLRAAARSDQLEEIEALRSVLRVADAWAQRGRTLSTPVQLSLLVAPVLLARIVAGAVRDPAGALGEMLRPITQRLSISKRDAERMRLILVAQERLAPAGRKRRGTAALVRRAYFPEALDLFELVAEASGDVPEEVERWRRRLHELGAPAPAAPARTAKRRPRRRRRREHGEKGARTG